MNIRKYELEILDKKANDFSKIIDSEETKCTLLPKEYVEVSREDNPKTLKTSNLIPLSFDIKSKNGRMNSYEVHIIVSEKREIEPALKVYQIYYVC